MVKVVSEGQISMKRLVKGIALVAGLTLSLGTIPAVQAANLSGQAPNRDGAASVVASSKPRVRSGRWIEQARAKALKNQGTATADEVTPYAPLNTLFNSYSDNANCSTWSGGDATNSVQLPDGQRAWFFSDSYIGSPNDRPTMFATSSVHNSVVVQNGSAMHTITGGNTCKERDQSIPLGDRYAKSIAEAPDAADANGFYWTGDQQLVGSNVIKFYYHGVPKNGLWINDYSAVAAIPAADLQTKPELTVTPTRLSCAAGGPAVLWGVMTLDHTSADGYTYVYGTSAAAPQLLYLARTTTANLTNFSAWQFFHQANDDGGADWSACQDTAALPVGATTTGSVQDINGSVWLVSMDATLTSIVARPASTPWGFTNRQMTLYTPPEVYENPYYYLKYEPRIQRGLTTGGTSPGLILSYNVNSLAVDTGCVSAHVYDANTYRPRFLEIPVSKFDASLPASSAAVAGKASPTTTFNLGRAPLQNPRKAPPKGFAGKRARALVTSSATAIGGITDWFPHWDDPCPNVPVPTGFSATANSDGSASLSWTAPGTDVLSFLYQCDGTATACATTSSCSSNAGGFVKQFGGLWLTTKSVRHQPITSQDINGHRFNWYVCTAGAQNTNPIGTNGNGGASNHAGAVVTFPVPSAPANLTGVRSGATVTLSWSQVTFPSTSVFYVPFYWDITAGATKDNAVALPSVLGTTTTVTLPSSTHTYGFYLRAWNFAGYSVPSTTKTF
jgi:hypothetical protein